MCDLRLMPNRNIHTCHIQVRLNIIMQLINYLLIFNSAYKYWCVSVHAQTRVCVWGGGWRGCCVHTWWNLQVFSGSGWDRLAKQHAAIWQAFSFTYAQPSKTSALRASEGLQVLLTPNPVSACKSFTSHNARRQHTNSILSCSPGCWKIVYLNIQNFRCQDRLCQEKMA